MNPERFARIKEILLAVERLPAETRAAHLDEACGGDDDLRREVEALMAQDSGSFALADFGALAHAERMEGGDSASQLEARSGGGADEDGERTPRNPARRSLPKTIGQYRILGILGEGGMGVVYHAEQTGTLRREVALKLIRGGLDSAAVVERFELERQTLALMSHPNIAQVLDAGTDGDGNPFFVMELVRGVAITRFCRDEGLDLPARLALFRTVCNAVQHAHRKGVIHRDLKPSNVLVAAADGEIVPKVIDFGVAKALATEPTNVTLTREGHLIGTLEYMSPEQARGAAAAVDTRTDVYSLGVILYELVGNALPYDVRTLSIVDAVRVICEEPPRSLRRTSAGRLARIDSDLQTIVAKALEKNPERRYGSASELAADLERFLRSEPIVARPASPAYLFRMLAARHKAAFAGVATSVVFVLAFAVAMAVMLGRETRERMRAEREARKAERTNEFMQEVLIGSLPEARGQEVTVREMLARAGRKLDEGPPEDPSLEVAVRSSLARTYTGISRPEDAESQLRLALVALDRSSEDVGRDRALLLESLGSAIYYQGTRNAEAESLYLAALAVRTQAPGGQPEVAGLLNNLAMLRNRRGDFAGAEAMLRESIQISRRLFGDDFDTHALRLSNLARNVESQGRLDEAESLLRDALEQDRRKGLEFGVAQTSMKLGSFLLRVGKYAGADSLLAPAAATMERLSGDDATDSRAYGRLEIGQLRIARGEPASAETLISQALALWSRAPENARTLQRKVGALHHLGLAFAAQGRFAEADSVHSCALDILRTQSDEDGPQMPLVLQGIADVRRRQGRMPEAEEYLRQALQIGNSSGVKNPVLTASCAIDLAMLLLENDRAQDAEPVLRDCLEQTLTGGWASHWTATAAKHQLACALNAQARAGDEATRLWAETRDAMTSASSPVPFALRERLLRQGARTLP
ncbi:MAG: protein kinase domain-containing protein [bacterium]